MKISNHTLCNILATIVGIAEVYTIRKYGVYPIPYGSLFFLAVGIVCDSIEKTNLGGKND